MIDRQRLNAIVRTETLVSIAINAFIPAGIIWLAEVPAPAALGGGTGLVQGMLKASGLATFAMTLALTSILRVRVRKGGLPALQPSEVTGPGRLLPQPLIARAIVMAVVAMVLLVPVGVAVAVGANILPLTRVGALLFNILFGALVGLVMTAPIVRRGLADETPR